MIINVLIAGLLSLSSTTASNTTDIPDANFEQALIDLGIDTNGLNGNILNTDAEAVTYLSVSSMEIADLTGIEAFTALTSLHCSSNLLTSLDVTQNTLIRTLNCRSNQLESLDLSQNTELFHLNCNSNQLTELDVTNNAALVEFYCESNDLGSLDVSQNTLIKRLGVQNTNLESLDISNNINLESLNCGVNQINTLDVTNNTELIYLYARFNQLSTINLSNNLALKALDLSRNQFELLDVSNNTLLESLICNSNNLTDLNLASNTALKQVYAHSNSLNIINVKNGNNSIMTTFYITDNPGLYCVEVDDPTYSATNWTDIDEQISFNLDCRTYVPDDNFEQALIDLGYDAGELDDYVPLGGIISVTSLSIAELSIADLTGIEDFLSLETLNCSNNQLTGHLDLSTLLSLSALYANNNTLLASLNVKNGNNSNFTVFNTSNTPNLYCIEVDDAVYSALNWSSIDLENEFSRDCSIAGDNTYVPDDNFEQALIDLGYDYGDLDDYVATANINDLTSLSVMGLSIADLTGVEDFVALKTLICINNELNSLDVTNLTELEVLYCNGNNMGSLNLSQNPALRDLKCGSNNFRSLDLSANPEIYWLGIDNCQIEELDVSHLSKLEILAAQNNQLTKLDLSSNPLLTTIYCDRNDLTKLVLSNGANESIEYFDASVNAELTCIEVDDAAHSAENWTSIDEWASFSEDCHYDRDGDGVTDDQEVVDGTDPENGCEYVIANQTAENVSAEWNAMDCDCDGTNNEDEISAGTNPILLSTPTGSATQSFCPDSNPTVASLTASGSGIKWYGSVDAVRHLISTMELTSGTYYASQTVGSCESERFAVEVIIETPAVPTGSETQIFCVLDVPTVAQLEATGTNIKWYAYSSEGEPLSSTEALNTGKYYASQTLYDCVSDRFEVDVTVVVSDAPSGYSYYTFCLSDEPTVAEFSTNEGGDIRWYESEIEETPLLTTTALANGRYYASQTVSGCESNRFEVEVYLSDPQITSSNEDMIFEETRTLTGNMENGVFSLISGPASLDGDFLTATGVGVIELGYQDELECMGYQSISVVSSDQDGDGVPDDVEAADNTTIEDGCSFNIESQEIADVSEEWSAMDCDGDGVTNGAEVSDETDVQDFCDFDTDSQSLDPSDAWLDADCDGDGVKNGEEGNEEEEPSVMAIDQQDFSNAVKIYPNPTLGRITIELEESAWEVSVNIRDLTGKTVWVAPLSVSGEIHIDGKPGIYIVTLETRTGHRKSVRVTKR